jgi:hypothetical protein
VPDHLRTGRRGEEDASFYLRRRGYIMVARNFRTPNRRGEIDLIGWHEDVLCFVEVRKPPWIATNGVNFSLVPGNTCVTCRIRASGASKSSACIMTSNQAAD